MGQKGDKPLLSRLNAGERACLELVARGMVSKEIARSLGLSPHTVDDRLRSAARKLGARNRFQAAQILASDGAEIKILKNNDTSSLRYEDSGIPEPTDAGDKRASAGEGDGPGDLRPDTDNMPESRDSGRRRSWLELNHPLAEFLGGENRLPITQRLLLIVAIAIAVGMLLTALVNSFVGLSQMLSSP